jgi:hypothetical protein
VREQQQHVPKAAYAGIPDLKSTAQGAPGLTIAPSLDLRGRTAFRLVRSRGLPDHRTRRDSNYFVLSVSMAMTGSGAIAEIVGLLDAADQTRCVLDRLQNLWRLNPLTAVESEP